MAKKQKHVIIVRDDQTKARAVSIINNLILEPPNEVVVRPYKEVLSDQQRSKKMNKSLHKWLTLLAEELNDAGFTQRELIGKFKKGFELPVTAEMLKDIFREVGKAMYHKESTADLSNIEMIEVHRVVEQRFSEITGVFVPWPCDKPPPY